MAAKSESGGFKTRLAYLDRQIKKTKAQLEKLGRLVKRANDAWTNGYHSAFKLAIQGVNLKALGTKKAAKIRQKVEEWPAKSIELTKKRDDLRKQIKDADQRLAELGTERVMLWEKHLSATRAENEIVTQVFALNEIVVRASADREDCLKRHVFPRLMDEHGQPRSQITFTATDGLRRVVAMVNTMTIVRGDLASAAKAEIENFFSRFEKEAKLDDSVKPLYDLTRQILVEKTDFKVGPDLYRFLGWELDPEIFPELAKAQALLGESIRSEKTNSYIRIYQRASRTDNWEPVRQS